jgi:hypothetical protein
MDRVETEALKKREDEGRTFDIGGPSLFHLVWNFDETGIEEEFQQLNV